MYQEFVLGLELCEWHESLTFAASPRLGEGVQSVVLPDVSVRPVEEFLIAVELVFQHYPDYHYPL